MYSFKLNICISQLFSEEVIHAMELFQNDPRCPELHDAGPTIAFIKRVNRVIKAMTSRTPWDALRLHDDCEDKKVNYYLMQHKYHKIILLKIIVNIIHRS